MAVISGAQAIAAHGDSYALDRFLSQHIIRVLEMTRDRWVAKTGAARLLDKSLHAQEQK
jgi:hypothetical protein